MSSAWSHFILSTALEVNRILPTSQMRKQAHSGQAVCKRSATQLWPTCTWIQVCQIPNPMVYTVRFVSLQGFPVVPSGERYLQKAKEANRSCGRKKSLRVALAFMREREQRHRQQWKTDYRVYSGIFWFISYTRHFFKGNCISKQHCHNPETWIQNALISFYHPRFRKTCHGDVILKLVLSIIRKLENRRWTFIYILKLWMQNTSQEHIFISRL